MEIQSSILELKPGIYVLRHPKAGLPPLTVTRAPGSAAAVGKINILSTPDTHGTILRNGADCIVMQVLDGPVDLLVTAYLDSAGAPVPSLKVDRIALDDNGAAAAPAAGSARSVSIGANGISIIGHVERTGDVVAPEGKLLGDPASTLRIEGFQLMWPDRPDGVELAYSIAVEGVGTLPLVSTGKFCGTRGQARRITEVTFVLTGPKASQYQLEGVACFTGGFQMPVTSGLTNSGPSGLEHLTALSLRAVKAKAATKPAKNPWDESAKTKVFKAPKKVVPKKSTTKPEKIASK